MCVVHRKSELCTAGDPLDRSRNPPRADIKFTTDKNSNVYADFTIKAHKTDRIAAWMPKRLFMGTDVAGMKLNACAHLRELVALDEANRPTGSSDPSLIPLFRLSNGKPLSYAYFKSWL